MKKAASRRSFYAFFCLRAGGWVLRRPGGEQVLRLRARDGEFRAPARVTFFFCKKKVTKENHLDLRSKNPLARGGQVQIWRCVLAGGVQRSSLSVKRTVPAFTGAEASATACPATVGVFASTGLAIIKSRLCRGAAKEVAAKGRHLESVLVMAAQPCISEQKRQRKEKQRQCNI